jgi:hypothetical protein
MNEGSALLNGFSRPGDFEVNDLILLTQGVVSPDGLRVIVFNAAARTENRNEARPEVRFTCRFYARRLD